MHIIYIFGYNFFLDFLHLEQSQEEINVLLREARNYLT